MAYRKLVLRLGTANRVTLQSTKMKPNCFECVRNLSSGSSKADFPSFSTTGDFKTFIKGPDYVTVSSMIVQGVPNVPFSKLVSQSNHPTLQKLQGQTPDTFTEGAVVAVETVTRAIRHAMEPETHDEALETLQQLLTPACYQGVLEAIDSLSRDKQRADLIRTPKDDIFFSWLASTKMINNELRFIFCAYSIPNYALIRDDYNNQKTRIDAFKEEIKRQQESGADPNRIQEQVKNFTQTLHNPREPLGERHVVISNFHFVTKDDDEWKVDEILMRNSLEVWTALGKFRWKTRILLSILMNQPFLTVLRFDYFSDWIVLIIAFNVVLFGSYF